MSQGSGAVDLHHHIVPPAYAKALARLGISRGLGVQLPRWDAHKALDVMDANGIATSVVSISAPGVHFPDKDPTGEVAKRLAREVNEICASLVREHPGRFGAFATLPLPDVDAALDELAYALDVLRLDGVILLSNYDGYYLGDERFRALFEAMQERGTVVFVHPQSPPGQAASHLGLPEAMLDVTFDTTRTAYSLMVNGVTKHCPDVRFVLAHAGGAVPYLAGRVGVTATMLDGLRPPMPAIAKGMGKLYGISASWEARMPEQLSYYLRFTQNVLPEGPDHFLSRFYYDTALSASPHCFASLMTLVDPTRVVFGTDYIFATDAAVPLTVDGVRSYPGFTPADVNAVMEGNARRLLPDLPRAAVAPLRT